MGKEATDQAPKVPCLVMKERKYCLQAETTERRKREERNKKHREEREKKERRKKEERVHIPSVSHVFFS